MVALVALQHHLAAPVPLHELEHAVRRRRVRVVVGAVERLRRQAAEHVPGQDAEVRDRGVRAEERCVHLLHPEHDGLRVRGRDAGHVRPQLRGEQRVDAGVGGIHQQAVREDDVVGGERLAVGPRGRAQLERDREAVGGGGRQRLGQQREQRAVHVLGQQRVVQERRDLAADRVADQHGRELLRIGRRAQDDVAARPRGLGARRAAAARREQLQSPAPQRGERGTRAAQSQEVPT